MTEEIPNPPVQHATSSPRLCAEPTQLLRGLLTMNVLLIMIAVAHGFFQSGDVGRHTDSSYVIFISALEMFATAACAFAICKYRCQQSLLSRAERSRCGVWALIGLGFVYLPVDECFELHQKLDKLIHYAWKMQETALSDRIDDAIIALYGAIGAGVVVLGWKELQGRIKARWLLKGFVAMGISVIFDAISDRPDVATWLIGNAEDGKLLNGVFQAIEALFQIAAQSIFLAAFYDSLISLKRRSALR